MSVFICEKCGKLDNTALSNNYWHASGNKYRESIGEEINTSYSPQFSYFENHVCCSVCCNGIKYKDGSGIILRGRMDLDEMKHWSDYGKEKMLEWESRRDGSMVNATEYFKSIGEL